MNSWDCFDTLIARRFYHPHTVFDEVGNRLGDPNFKDKRIKAEIYSNNTYSGIYNNLPGIDPDIECQVELEHCFPIVENMNKVEDGDLILSDMYHTPEFIEKLLRKCGLTKTVKVIVTPNGKSSGNIWKSLPPIKHHLGDNYISDVQNAISNGINATHYTECHFNELEDEISKYDFHLACWMRYIRLSFPFQTKHQKSIWIDQANCNIPALALGSFELPEKPLVFTLRDCIFWKPIYEALMNKESYMFHSSRHCYGNPSQEYIKYVKEATEGKVIVDIHGSGNSAKKFFGYMPEIVFLVGTAESCITKICTDVIERHNCANFGSLIGWNENGAIRAECEHDANTLLAQSEAVKVACNSINFFKISKNLSLLRRFIDKMYHNYTDLNVKHVSNHI